MGKGKQGLSAKELMNDEKSSDFVNVQRKDPRRSRTSFVAASGPIEGLYVAEQLPNEFEKETGYKSLSREEKVAYVRNVIAFFLIGLINNYPYVVFNR